MSYEYGKVIHVHPHVMEDALKKKIIDTIELIGLDREPWNPVSKPTKRDTRWQSRLEAWAIAKESLNDYVDSGCHELLSNQIVRTAKTQGHFSIWMRVFQEYPVIKNKLIEAFPVTHIACFDEQGDASENTRGQI